MVKKLLSNDEAAEILGVSERTIRRYQNTRGLKYQIVGNVRVTDPADIAAFRKKLEEKKNIRLKASRIQRRDSGK